MESTFAQVLEAAVRNDKEVVSYVDSVIPAGHFAAISAGNDGDKVIYLLEGEKNAPEAAVKGFILSVFDEDDRVVAFGYAQDSRKVETSLGQAQTYRGKTESFESVFAQMV